MMSKSIVLSVMVLLLAALSLPARAGPVDIIDVQDELFGVSQTEIFVLRTVSDNLGSHSNLVSTVFLVAIDRATGDEVIWPVHRARVQPVDRVELGGAQVEVLADVLADARNPFEILTQRRAMSSGSTAQFSVVEPVSGARGQTLTIVEQDGADLMPSPEDLFSDLKKLTARLATKMEPYGRPGVLTIGDLLNDPLLSSGDCSAGPAIVTRFPADMPSVQIARITCGLAENGFRLSVLHLVPVSPSDHANGGE